MHFGAEDCRCWQGRNSGASEFWDPVQTGRIMYSADLSTYIPLNLLHASKFEHFCPNVKNVRYSSIFFFLNRRQKYSSTISGQASVGFAAEVVGKIFGLTGMCCTELFDVVYHVTSL